MKRGENMKDLTRKIKLERADYRKIAKDFNMFMSDIIDCIENAMIKQIPEFAELDQTRNIILSTTLKML